MEPPATDHMLDAIRDHAIFSLDDDGRITSWSVGATGLTGYAADEAVGLSFSVFGTHENEADLARMLNTVREEGSSARERWWRQRHGGLIWAGQTISRMGDSGFVVVARDCTRQAEDLEQRLADDREAEGLGRERKLRAELQAAERRAAFLAEASSILVATSLDFDSTIRALVRLAVSRLSDWCVIHALHDDDLVRAAVAHRDPRLEQKLETAIDGLLTDEWRQTVLSVASTGQSEILERETVARWFATDDEDAEGADRSGDADDSEGADGGEGIDARRRDAASDIGGSAMVTPLMGRGRILGAITLVAIDPDRIYDEEDLDLAEELGRRAAMALDNARLYSGAQEANRAKADFLAVMSHELRTPLNAIMGYSDLLDAGISGELSDRQRKQVQRVRASARHLLQLIEEILSFARIEAGGEEVRLELTKADVLADEAAAVIEPMAAARDIEFGVEIVDPEVTMETDTSKARQILVNVLSNAVKFTERGSVTLRFRRDGQRAVFDVIDTGVGIPEDQLERIFEPFHQVERPNTRRFGGTGIGLSVSRRYARLIRGELVVRSEPGRGTTFTLSLPLRITGGPGERN